MPSLKLKLFYGGASSPQIAGSPARQSGFYGNTEMDFIEARHAHRHDSLM